MKGSILFLALVIVSFGMRAQTDSVMVRVAADTLGSDQQEGGIPAEALNYYNEAIQAISNGIPDSAVALFGKALAIAPKFSKAIFNRASTHVLLQDYGAALSDIDRYLQSTDTAKTAYFLRAEILDYLGRSADAIQAYGQAIEKQVRLEKSFLNRARLHLRETNYQEAIDDFTAYLRYAPSDAIAIHDRGSLYFSLGKFDKAEADYRQAVLLNPKFGQALANLGTALREQSQFQEAIAKYSEALKITPGDPLILNNRGYAYFLNGEFDAAEKDFLKALEKDAKYTLALNNLAGVYIKQERFKEAVEISDRTISIDPKYGYAYLNRGIAREMIRDIKGACEDWTTAAEMNVKNAETYRQGLCKYVNQ